MCSVRKVFLTEHSFLITIRKWDKNMWYPTRKIHSDGSSAQLCRGDLADIAWRPLEVVLKVSHFAVFSNWTNFAQTAHPRDVLGRQGKMARSLRGWVDLSIISRLRHPARYFGAGAITHCCRIFSRWLRYYPRSGWWNVVHLDSSCSVRHEIQVENLSNWTAR